MAAASTVRAATVAAQTPPPSKSAVAPATPQVGDRGRAGPHIVIFGGGWGPEGTQQSLEAQVDALQRTLAHRAPTVLFAGGAPSARSVQVPGPVDETTRLLGLVFNQRRDLHAEYRAPQIRRSGPASRTGLLRALLARNSTRGTIVFGVGHGSLNDDGQSAALELWGPDDRLTPESLASALDEGRRGPTAFVLGQCHAGAFATIVHRQGKTARPVARPTRCVFAAVPADREASGCTVDLTDAGAQAYVTRFTMALADRAADFDADGAVDLAEAHAHARIHDATIDVPVSSLELFVERAIGPDAPDPANSDMRRLIASASATDAAVLKALGPTYAAASDGMMWARRDFDDVQRRLQVVHAQLDALQERFETTRHRLLDRLLLRWPELSNPYHAVSRALLAGPAPAVMAWLRQQPELAPLQALDTKLGRLDRRLLAIEKEAARRERWLRAAQHVANEAALSARGRHTATLSALRACEKMIP